MKIKGRQLSRDFILTGIYRSPVRVNDLNAKTRDPVSNEVSGCFGMPFGYYP
jgi:hypothetical protein